MSVYVDPKGNSITVQCESLPRELLPSWSLGINKLFDFLEERERVHAAIQVDIIADSRIEALLYQPVALRAD